MSVAVAVDPRSGRCKKLTRETRHGHTVSTLDGGDDTVSRGGGREGSDGSEGVTHFDGVVGIEKSGGQKYEIVRERIDRWIFSRATGASSK